MLGSIRNAFKALYLKRLVKHGLVVGSDFQMEKGCNIDANFPWLIEIGNNVTFASNVCLLAHDGSTKKLVGYSKVGKVSVGDNVFIGCRTFVSVMDALWVPILSLRAVCPMGSLRLGLPLRS